MKTIVVYIFCVALLPTAIIALNKKIVNVLNDMASNGEDINSILKPSINGLISQNDRSVTFAAFFVPLQQEVSVKLTPTNLASLEEFKFYSYLNAVDNLNVEAYGIPTIHYFDMWSGYTVLATKLLESNLITKSKTDRIEPLDILIIIREFVQISKYIHSCGILHNDIKLENIMFDQHKVFIIDYSSATKLNKSSHSGTLNFKSRRGHGTGNRCAKDDWESFLYSLCHFLGIKLDWFDVKDEKTVYRLKLNTAKTMKKITESSPPALKSILVELANEVFDDEYDPEGKINNWDPQKFPHYNNMEIRINEEIDRQKGRNKYALFSWLSEENKKIAKTELANAMELDIDNPRYNDDYTYTDPNYFVFTKKYHDPTILKRMENLMKIRV